MLPLTTLLAILIYTEIFLTHGAKLLNAHEIRYVLERSITKLCVLRCFEIVKYTILYRYEKLCLKEELGNTYVQTLYTSDSSNNTACYIHDFFLS